MKMPETSLLDWQKNLELKQPVRKHGFMLDGQKDLIDCAADVKNSVNYDQKNAPLFEI